MTTYLLFTPDLQRLTAGTWRLGRCSYKRNGNRAAVFLLFFRCNCNVIAMVVTSCYLVIGHDDHRLNVVEGIERELLAKSFTCRSGTLFFFSGWSVRPMTSS